MLCALYNSVQDELCLSVSLSILYYMMQNTVDVIRITNTRYQKRKDNVKKKFILIYRYND